jgi:predicted extracellular nuclease
VVILITVSFAAAYLFFLSDMLSSLNHPKLKSCTVHQHTNQIRNFNYCIMRKIYFALFFLTTVLSLLGQTNPLPQALPLSFTTQTGNTLPAGIAVHRFGTTTGIPTSRTLIPGNGDLPYNSTSNAGGWRDEAANGIGILASSSQAAGALIVAINTTGQSNIQIAWTIRTILQQTSRDNSIALQYRIGTTGNFIDIGTTSTYTSVGQVAGHSSNYTELLPTPAENQPEVQLRWIYWESAGSAGSRDRLAVDDISVTTGTPSNTISIVSGTNASEPSINGNFTINFSPVTTGAITFDYALSGSASFTTDYGVSLSAGTPTPFTSNSGTISVPAGTNSIVVTVIPNDDLLSEGPENIILQLSNPTGGYTINIGSGSIVLIDNETSPINSIQGSGTAATAGVFTIEAIVTGVYPNLSPAGFYIQEEDADADVDPATSEAIFVVSNAAVAVGDRVSVVGTVQENGATPSFNQAVVTSPTVNILSSGNPLPTLTDISLPVSNTTFLERYEGMLVRYPYELTVTSNDDLGNFGELNLSRNGILYQPSQLVDPNDNPSTGNSFTGNSNVAAVTALFNSNTLRTILLDDGRGTTNSSPLAYVDADNTLRLGSTVTNLTGIMGFGFSKYRTQPLPAGHPYASPSFSYAARPTLPDVGAAANLRVASFNVLNYFNGDGVGGGFPTARGASNAAEFGRQRNKIISAITQINADIVGLIEIENDGTGGNSAIQDLVNGLNAVLGAGTYSFINDGASTQTFNTDLIRCGILYKSAIVTPIGSAMTDGNAVFDRPPLAHNFQVISSGINLNFIVNHFKSKGSCPTSGVDLDQGDGQACWNDRRREQALALINFINTTVIPTSGNNRIISVGDYNAYFEEDPMDRLRANGLQVLSTGNSFSYAFNGQLGSLDHAVITPSLALAVTGIAKWNINSVEPSYLDYNDGPWSATYTPTPWRSSDHDPVIIGLNITAALPVRLTDFTAYKQNGSVTINWKTAEEINTKEFIIERSTDGINYTAIGNVTAANSSTGSKYNWTDNTPATVNYYRLKMVDQDGKFAYSKVVKINFGKQVDVQITPNPASTYISIQINNTLANTTVQLIDLNGRIVKEQRLNQNPSNNIVSLTGVAKGLYHLKIISNQHVITEKVMVQ